MTNGEITISNAEYKKIFLDITEKLFDKGLINNEERIKLRYIINNDKRLSENEN